MNWFKCLFRRKPKPVPFQLAEPGPDIIGRQGGQKRNRVHVYLQPYGYPIRACDWVAEYAGNLEILGRWQGPSKPETPLGNALLYYADGRPICRHCQAFARGKRSSIGMENHGHGKPKGFNCSECGQYLETPLTRHTFEDCEEYKKNHGHGKGADIER